MKYMNAKIQNLYDAILKVRDCGEVTFSIEERSTLTGSITTLLDEFVAKFKLVGLSGSWKEIGSSTAREIVSEVIFRDLAYGVSMTTEEHAFCLAEQFLSNFVIEPRFFTNGTHENGRLSNWYPISEATFDIGVICLDDQRIGILWVQDED